MPVDQSYLTKVAKMFSRIVRQSGPYMTASYTLIGAIIGLSLGGYLVDEWLHTSPWFLMAGLVIGVMVGSTKWQK